MDTGSAAVGGLGLVLGAYFVWRICRRAPARPAASGPDCPQGPGGQHAFESVGPCHVETGQRLVNPDADPGATYLDSNFQPDYEYGLTETVLERVTTERCVHCGRERVYREERAVEDPR
jgi:hypothetical protein